MSARIVDSADVDPSATVGEGSSIWHLAQVREGAVIGEHVTVGRGAYIGSGVHVGDRCKIQNYALVYEPAALGHGVFIGPAVVLTNDTYPRAVTPDGDAKGAGDWERVGVQIDEGAAIGARSVCVAPVRIGAWALVAAGSVVVKDVPPSPWWLGRRPSRSAGSVTRACGLEPVTHRKMGLGSARDRGDDTVSRATAWSPLTDGGHKCPSSFHRLDR